MSILCLCYLLLVIALDDHLMNPNWPGSHDHVLYKFQNRENDNTTFLFEKVFIYQGVIFHIWGHISDGEYYCSVWLIDKFNFWYSNLPTRRIFNCFHVSNHLIGSNQVSQSEFTILQSQNFVFSLCCKAIANCIINYYKSINNNSEIRKIGNFSLV